MKARCHLKQHRGQRTLAQLSAQTGISAPNLSMLERGRLIPTDHDAEALATCLNVPVALLWHFNGPWLAVEPDAQENAA